MGLEFTDCDLNFLFVRWVFKFSFHLLLRDVEDQGLLHGEFVPEQAAEVLRTA